MDTGGPEGHGKQPGALTRVAAAVAQRLPDRLLVQAIGRAHRRFERELQAIDVLLPATRRTAVDIGAWYGPWTLALASRFDRVVALEPNANVASRLRAALPDNVTLEPFAASDVEGTALLYAPDALGAEGVGSLNEPSPDHRCSVVKVQRCTIDSLGLTKVDFMKVDVEGHEMEALGGATQTLERDRPVLVVELEERLAPVRPVLGLLDGLGYRPHVVHDGQLVSLDPVSFAGATGPPRSYLAAVLRPDPDAPVNNVVFLP